MKLEPVRVYAVAAAALALAAHYLPDLPVALVLGLVAAVLGLGEAARSRVTPTAKVLISTDDLGEGEAAFVGPLETR